MPSVARTTWLVLLPASVLFAGLALGQAATDAPTFDEPTYLTAGLTAWTRHDLRINPQHPPLAKLVASAPVLLLRPAIPRGSAWRSGNEHALSAALVRAELRARQLRRIVFVSRLAPIAEAIAAGWVVAALAELLFGAGTGWLPGALWLLNPVVLGLGHIDGIDIPFALATLATALAVGWARERPTGRRAVVVGVLAGAAVLTRVTGLLVLPAAALAVAAAAPRGARLSRAVAVGGAAWAALAALYAAVAPAAIISHRSGVIAVPVTVARLAVPAEWLHGLGYLARAGSRPGPAFILGRAHVGRWPWFWPASALVKLPAPTLLLLIAAVAGWRWLRRPAREVWWVIGLPGVLLAVFALQQQRPLGIRYFLPALALWIVASAPLTGLVRGRFRLVAAAAVIASLLVSVLATPALAWTNPVLGQGYRVAADSNLDWGQGFWALRRWSVGRHPWVQYFGGAGLDVQALAGARDLRAAPADVTGWVAVSASFLTDYDRGRLAWLRVYCPIEVIDQTILVYRFARPPSRSARWSAAPARPCHGRFSRPVA